MIGSISLKSWLDELKNGRRFWLPVVFNIIGEIIAFGIGMILSAMLPNLDDGLNVFKLTGWISLIAFIITTILLPSIAEESFYRKGIINFNSKTSLIFSSIIGIILYASEHSLKPLGLLISAIWAIPFTITYIRTKNIYIPMTAHFICNFAANGMTAVIMAAKMLKIL
ncbi:CPBP family intramembrane metalloprotease [Aceticella autotrophica]|uniref:CPBP family intramembrane metalloprotease n=1 Tax=Aceticella autotrophica TaxID=2755338 RepID=A0A975AXA8_9THEO|nr:CPBP family intramembrane glutamic endopeptidase [Aceticella autotrophica]QSZ28205.1 CPBP family intramembrane metalloprotease [Aceticella autotrophica]